MSSNEIIKKLIKQYEENKLAHAFLVETNDYNLAINDLKKLFKKIFCSNEYKEDCNLCNNCMLINKDEFPNLYIISPEGKDIKKDQILELERKCSLKNDISDKKIYVILNADKLNKYSENSMLKFVEEPFDNCYGFFIVNNKESLLATIRSRCQIINLKFKNDFLDVDEEILDITKKYLYALENTKKNILINREILINYITERNFITNVFKTIYFIYKSSFDNKDILLDNMDIIKNQNKNILYKKINLTSEILKKICYNVNLELLLDFFAIRIGEINEKYL